MILPLQLVGAPFEAAGYLPDYRMDQIGSVSAAEVSDVILFSIEVRPDGGLDLARLPEEKLLLAAQWARSHRARPWLAVGGWERSAGFAGAAADPLARRRMAQECRALCVRLGLAGIDLDWEHPKSRDEEAAYAALMTTLKSELAPDFGLSAAIAGWQRLPAAAWRALDRVNLMAYDHEGRHSTLEQAQSDVEALIRQGAAAGQIRLGLPFYGRHRQNRTAMAYSEIAEKFRPASEQDEAEDIFWNGPETIRRKAAWARARGLAGVMIWEIAQDGQTGSLRRAIRQGLSPPAERE
jgi:GH18 family chitinase